jgi:hypothetical protein
VLADLLSDGLPAAKVERKQIVLALVAHDSRALSMASASM